MTDPTLLDLKHAAMQSGGFAEQLSFYQSLTDSALILWTEDDAPEDEITPKVVELDGGNFVLAFDLDERLADMAGGIAQTATLPGRGLARMLQGKGIGIALNLGVAPSAILMPPEAIDWIVNMLDQSAAAHVETLAQPKTFELPANLPEPFVAALSEKLQRTGVSALLTGVTYDNETKGHLLVFVDVDPTRQGPITDAISEALAFSALEAGTIDVSFLNADDPRLAVISANAYRIEVNTQPQTNEPTAPGTDPDNPPILR